MPDADTEKSAFVLERVFAAPPETVWRAWTEAELFARWYKPNQNCQTAVLQHELAPGGVLLYEMRFEGMPPHIERWVFESIEPPRRLEWLQTLADADGNVIDNPRMPDWPRVMHTMIELEAHADGTLQRLTWRPHEASDAQVAFFGKASAQGGQGWASGFDNLGALVKELAG